MGPWLHARLRTLARGGLARRHLLRRLRDRLVAP